MSRSSSIGSSSSRRPRFGSRPDPLPLLRLLQRDVSRVQGVCRELKQENNDLAVALKESKTLIDDLRIELQETQINLGTVKQDLGVARQEIIQLRTNLEEVVTNLEKLEEDVLTENEDGESVVRCPGHRSSSPPPSPPFPFSPLGGDSDMDDDDL